MVIMQPVLSSMDLQVGALSMGRGLDCEQKRLPNGLSSALGSFGYPGTPLGVSKNQGS